ncbi:amino acid adenylation domain-containing protein [Streptomyces sp. NPDC049915]|uniref:amino acid adenylation domain-containing protein n=1 Tax=Streptomyces sp. NPDC049915 TaxID=3155510 RepID=UPI0034175BE0
MAQRLDQLFARAVRGHGDRTAVTCGTETMTYRQLDAASARLARRLQDQGIGPGSRVAVCMDRSTGLLVALLGVVRAGAAYVPLDPAHPEERRAHILDDSAATLVLTDTGVAEGAGGPGAPRPVLLVDGDAVYTIYTSGSTGRPKGVTVTHGALANFLCSMAQRPGLPDGATLVAVTTVAFDIAALELFLPLTLGGHVVIATPEESRDPRALAGLIQSTRASALQATPATWRMLRSDGWRPPDDFTLLCGGEPLPPDLACWFGDCGGRAWDLYGPTETTIWSSTALLDGTGTVARWWPVARTTFHVLDEALRPVPAGQLGEVFIGGAGLAAGYHGQPALTAERFLPDPYDAGARLYRTGDLGRFRPDGSLEIAGRTDHQVKIRGHRVELGEIEAAAVAVPGVRMAVAHPWPDPAGGVRLVMYVVPGGSAVPSAGELRAALARTLPSYMLPSQFVTVETFPLTPNGKVDRARLPEPGHGGDDGAGGLQAPATETERFLADAWSAVLGVSGVGRHDDFLDLGGHSLAAVALSARVRTTLGRDISVGELLRHPTLAAQASLLEQASRVTDETAAPEEGSAGDLPLTSAQQRVLFAESVRTGGSSYATSVAYRVTGPLDTDALDDAVQTVAARHDALRCRFPVPPPGAPPVQRIDDTVRIPVTVLPGGLARPEADRLLEEAARAPFDLGHDPLLRVVVARTAGREALILFCWHHLVFDGWSLGLFLDDLDTAYTAALVDGSPPRPPAARYARAVALQRAVHESPATAAQLSHWTEQLAGLPELCTVPEDRPRPAVQSARGALATAEVEAQTGRAFLRLCRSGHVTPYTGLLTVFLTLLGRYANSSDVVVGTPSAGRSHVESQQVVGLFANTLALRADLAGAPTFAALSARVKDVVYEALEHQDIPFERVVEALRPERSLGHNPVFQVLFTLEGQEVGRLRLAGTRTEPVHIDGGGSRYDLAVTVRDEEDGRLGLAIEYTTDLYDRETVEGVLRQYTGLITYVCAAGAEADLSAALAAGVDRTATDGWNSTAMPPPAADTVHGLVRQQVRTAADRVAVRCGDRTLTYGGLGADADALASELVRRGIGPGDVVGVYAERDLALPVALLAVLTAGAAYLPLDPGYPPGRLTAILDEARPPLVLTTHATAGLLPDGGPEQLRVDALASAPGPAPALPVVVPDDTAYVIHTSGSTGTPKGVCLPHRALVDLTQWQLRDQLGGVRTAQLASIGFDVHFQEIFIPLASGGTVLLAPEAARRDPEALFDWLSDTGAEQVICTPTLFAGFAAEARRRGHVPAGLREVTTAGEQLRLTDDVLWVLRHGTFHLHNQYGPSETHAATALPVPEPEDEAAILPPPIGRPVGNKRVYVLDEHGRELPVGVPGELYIASDGIAHGYLGLPRQTAERFLPDPFGTVPGGRMYRTGDLGRWLHRGVLEHRGRVDDQIKLRGVRIEPGEIEVLLHRHPAVRSAAVAVREPLPGEPVLTAYVVPERDAGEPNAGQLRRYLTERLPVFAVPTRYVTLAELPLTSSGKVHRAALPMPPHSGAVAERVAPRTPVEREIAQVWAEALGVTDVGAHDDFFMLGGHSLLAARLVTSLNRALDTGFHLRDLLAAPTVAGLAATMERRQTARDAGPGTLLPLDGDDHEGPDPLSFAQQRLLFLDRMHPGDTEFLLPLTLRLCGDLDPDALRCALDALSARHDILRTRYPLERGEPVPRVDPPGSVPVTREDLSHLGGEDRERLLGDIAAAERDTPFDLARQHPLRVRLVRLAAEDHLLLLTFHHIGGDGRSLSILQRELLELYAAHGTPAGVPARVPQYADFARWQLRYRDEEFLAPLVTHWLQVMNGWKPLDLPTDRPRPEVWQPEGDTLHFALPEGVWPRLTDAARRSAATPYTVLLTAFVSVLAEFSGQDDLVLGTPVSGRAHPQTATMAGSFVDLVVIRADASGAPSPGELLARVRRTVLDAFAHQELPFDRLVRELRPSRDLSRSPVVDVVFNFVEDTEPLPAPAGLTVTARLAQSLTTSQDLEMIVRRGPDDGLSAEIQYAAALFTPASVRRIADAFLGALDDLAPETERRATPAEGSPE